MPEPIDKHVADGPAEARSRIDKAGYSNSTTLDLSGLCLRDLPEDVGHLSSLKRLYLNNNCLRSVPACIQKLVALRVLDLSSNELIEIPDWIGVLSSLEIIYLQDNHLSRLPASFRHLRNLEKIELRGNPALLLPPELIAPEPRSDAGQVVRRPHSVLDYYFRTHDGDSRPLNEAKLILIGRGEVGKTSLVNRLVFNTFKREDKTQGIKITDWNVRVDPETKVRLHVWDFGGQEIMHATHQFFLTERTLYLVVLNGREGGEDVDVEYWLKLVESLGGDSPVIVVLNKVAQHPFDLNRRGLQEKYPNRIKHFIRTDCLDGTGIRELKEAVLSEVRMLPDLRVRFPGSWFAIKDQLPHEGNFISFERYRQLCVQFGEPDIQAQETLAVALHCLGVALTYKDDRRLRDTHVINPRWVTNGIYGLLNSPIVADRQGLIHIDDLARLLDPKEYPQATHEFILNLMRKFELCFRLPEPRDSEFLIPQLLSKEQPPLNSDFGASPRLWFRYSYAYLPEGLLPRFIVRSHALGASMARWRTGVTLRFESNTALVRSDAEEKRIDIIVIGPATSQRRLLAIIRSDFDRIHLDTPKLQPRAFIPLPTDPAIAIPYEELLAYEEAGIKIIHRVKDGRIIPVDVSTLLSSVDISSTRRVRPATVFISYSHKDEEHRADLQIQLKLFERLGRIGTWSDRRIIPGSDWREEIDQAIEKADLIIALVSADFIASDYCYGYEMVRALERHRAGLVRVVPIIVRECKWDRTPLRELQALPTEAKPVRSWSDRDAAWKDVADGLEQVLDELPTLD
jgi:internalin A